MTTGLNGRLSHIAAMALHPFLKKSGGPLARPIIDELRECCGSHLRKRLSLYPEARTGSGT
ncbi:MAG TPA: hypothetical protein VNK89_06405 [Thermoflexus sp.]|nr:hypothetical protein [Thermoflexus sp.]